jgi:hypothetical protein
MGYTQRLAWETLRSVDSATFTGVYVPIGGPLLHPSYILKIVNNSSVLVTISIDGVTDIDVLPANSFFLYDESNSGPYRNAVQQGTQFFAKGSAGTGLVYLVNQYLISI